MSGSGTPVTGMGSDSTVPGGEAPERLLARMREERGGSVLPAFEYLASIDPEYLDAYDRSTVLVFSYGTAAQTRALSAKTKELIAIALLAAVRGDTTQNHMARALRLGATRREVVEALEVALQVCGAPALEFGLRCLSELDAPAAPSQAEPAADANSP